MSPTVKHQANAPVQEVGNLSPSVAAETPQLAILPLHVHSIAAAENVDDGVYLCTSSDVDSRRTVGHPPDPAIASLGSLGASHIGPGCIVATG